MLIERLVYGMEYGGPLSMSQFSFGIFPLFGFRHRLLCLQPNSKQSAQNDMDMSWSVMTELWVDKRNRVAGMEPATLK